MFSGNADVFSNVLQQWIKQPFPLQHLRQRRRRRRTSNRLQGGLRSVTLHPQTTESQRQSYWFGRRFLHEVASLINFLRHAVGFDVWFAVEWQIHSMPRIKGFLGEQNGEMCSHHLWRNVQDWQERSVRRLQERERNPRQLEISGSESSQQNWRSHIGLCELHQRLQIRIVLCEQVCSNTSMHHPLRPQPDAGCGVERCETRGGAIQAGGVRWSGGALRATRISQQVGLSADRRAPRWRAAVPGDTRRALRPKGSSTEQVYVIAACFSHELLARVGQDHSGNCGCHHGRPEDKRSGR